MVYKNYGENQTLYPMPTLEEDNRRIITLKNQLNVIVLFENDLGLSKKEKEMATDAILDEMIEIFKRFKNQSKPDKNE